MGGSEMVRECNRCLLDKEVPGVQLGANGICSVCTDWDRIHGDWDLKKKRTRRDLEKILEKVRALKKPYDVLVPLSGGKDSTYVLYLCRKVFDLRCLAVTYDNGFLSNYAKENISKAVNRLGADHIYVANDKSLMIDLYRYFFLKTGFFCPLCMRGIQVAVSRIQKAFDVPLTMRGTSYRTEEFVSWQYFLPGNLDFIENVLVGSGLEEKARFLTEPVGMFKSPPQIMLPDFVDWDYDEIFRTINLELDWVAERPDSEHADCNLENTVSHIRYLKFPSLVPERLRYSKLATAGLMDKEEARGKVNWEGSIEPESMPGILSELGISRQELKQVLSDPMRHQKYLQKRSRAMRRMKAMVRRFVS